MQHSSWSFLLRLHCAQVVIAASLLASIAAAAPTRRAASPLDQYRSAGGPSPDAVWIAADYATLKRMIDERAIPLPRTAPHFTAPVFVRMTNPDNYVNLVTSVAPLADRLRAASEMSRAGAEILSVYVNGFYQLHLNVEDELALMTAYLLQMAARTTELLRELERIPRDQTAQRAVQGVLDQAGMSAGQILDGTVKILVRGSLAGRNRIRIVSGFRELFATRASRLSTATITDFCDRFAPLVQYEEDAEVKGEMKKAYDLCVATLESRKKP